MAQNIAPSDPDTYSLEQVDEGLEMILEGILLVENNIGSVKSHSDDQNKAKSAVDDIIKTALKPYTVDMFNALKVFDGG